MKGRADKVERVAVGIEGAFAGLGERNAPMASTFEIEGHELCGGQGREVAGLAGLDAAAIELLSAKAGIAFERLILDRKLRR